MKIVDKILTADFSSGKDRVTARGLWQFDRGVKLKVIGINVTDVNRVDFAPVIASEAVPVVVVPDGDGTFTVSIPGAATKSPYDVTAYIYVDTADYGYTVKAVNMPVILRQEVGKPGEEEKPDPFGEVVEKVSGYAKEAQDSAKAADESASKSEKIAEQVTALKEQVELSAKNANASEQAAGISEKNAAESERQARESAVIARSAADQAAKSATTAAESATTAAQLAENATRSATNASGSAESASQSAETAKTAADAAGKSASAAQQAAGSAAESASTASTAAQTATTAAGKAAESATSASQSAETASQKATAAETSASNAAESATEAGKSATAAGDSASAAKVSETAAAASAVTATEQAEKIKASAEQIEKNKTDVTSLKEDLGEFQDGFHNLNLWGKAELKYTDKYVNILDGKILYQPNDYGYGSWILPVDGTNQYSFSGNARFVLPLEEDKETATSNSLLQNITTIKLSDYPNTKYLAFSILDSSVPCVISEGDTPKEGFKLPNWISGTTQSEKDNISKGIVSKTGVFSESGSCILLPNARSNLRKGIRLVFEATVTSGTDFEIGFSISEKAATTYPHNIITVDDANIIYSSESYPHRLNIADRLQMIFEYLLNGTADITLISNGNLFKQNVPFVMSSVAVPYVKSNGLVATDCKLTFICTDIRKKIWMFGDSYFAYSSERWTYYLKEYGYDNNVLLDGFPGMGSNNGVASFKKLLSLGTPKIAVWFLGMNDGTDTDDVTPNADWATNRDIFIELCKANDIKPIFATIPNVPIISHNGKNAWIKSSGYRYVDMCHAVGADVNADWYGDMLSSDKIHPSESGAKALFAEVILDLPEIMIDNL